MMTKPTCTVALALLAAFLLLGIGGSAFAQTSAAPTAANAGGPPPMGPPPGAEDEAGRRAPVLYVTSVEVMRSTHPPQLDIIRARGLTATSDWDGGELVPLTHGTPSDGTLDLIFVARAPEEAPEATGFADIEATLRIEPGHPYKGFRVFGAANSVTLKPVPGYAESTVTLEDCSKCVGKLFVPKGGALPPGKTEADVVREEQLPATLRIIRTSQGIPKLDSDPNRLTIVVHDDGRIVTAVWD